MYIIYWDARKDDLQGTSYLKEQAASSRVFGGNIVWYLSYFTFGLLQIVLMRAVDDRFLQL